MQKKFQKYEEDFVCDKCSVVVLGNGFTNHCPKCLYSKHVDINPGDRKESCKGVMKVIGIEKKKDTYTLLHKCEKCGFERKNKIAKNDNFEEVLKIQSNMG